MSTILPRVMFILVDNTESERILFFVSKDGEEIREHIFGANGEGSLEKALVEVLDNEKVTLHDIWGIAVRVGVGRFTSTRLAVTFANTLALALKIPVVATEDKDLKKAIKELKTTPVGKYAHALYSSEPRIGGK